MKRHGERATVEKVEARRGLATTRAAKRTWTTSTVISVVAGTALALFGLRRFSFTRLGVAALGGSLVYRGLTGFCSLYDKLGVTTFDNREGVRGNLGTKIERSIVVYTDREKVYRFWRNFANLPRFMSNRLGQSRLPALALDRTGTGGVGVEWKRDHNETRRADAWVPPRLGLSRGLGALELGLGGGHHLRSMHTTAGGPPSLGVARFRRERIAYRRRSADSAMMESC